MIVDVFVIAVILISIVIAFLRGFVREVLTILGIVGGMAAAYVGGPLLVPYMSGWFGLTEENSSDKFFDILPYPILVDSLSYGVIFIVFVIILSIISHFLASFVKNLGLGILDRTLGVVFGFVRGVFVLGLMYLLPYYLASNEQKEKWFKSSKSYIYLEISSSWIDRLIPKTMADNMQDGMETVKDVSDTRKKLEEMDLLKRGSDNKSSPNKNGYSPEFRKDMDKLFEYNNDKSPSYNE